MPISEFKKKLAQGHEVFEYFSGEHPNIYNPLVIIMRKCLSKIPSQRPTSMEVLREIKNIRNDSSRKSDRMRHAQSLTFLSKLKKC